MSDPVGAMYEKNGFTKPIARIKETYQGNSYEYDLLLRTENERGEL